VKDRLPPPIDGLPRFNARPFRYLCVDLRKDALGTGSPRRTASRTV